MSKSSVLNLYNLDESKNFKISPMMDRVDLSYDMTPIHIESLHSDGFHIVDKLMSNEALVVSEQGRAEAAEIALQGAIDSGRTALDAIDAGLRTDIDAEVSRAVQVDNNFSASLAQEVADRQSGDQTLTTNLSFEVSRAQAAESVNASAVVTERQRAEGVEGSLRTDLEFYALDLDKRDEADVAALNAYILSNNQRATQNEDAHNSLVTKQQGDMDQEIADRQDAINQLQTQINFITSNTDAGAIDSLTEIVSNFNASGSTYASRLSAIEQILNDLVNSGL